MHSIGLPTRASCRSSHWWEVRNGDPRLVVLPITLTATFFDVAFKLGPCPLPSTSCHKARLSGSALLHTHPEIVELFYLLLDFFIYCWTLLWLYKSVGLHISWKINYGRMALWAITFAHKLKIIEAKGENFLPNSRKRWKFLTGGDI